MFKVADDLMQMIFITIDENEIKKTNQPDFDEKQHVETACTGCYSGCVGSCLNVCSGSGKNCSGA